MFFLSLKKYIHTFILIEYIKIKVTGNEKTYKSVKTENKQTRENHETNISGRGKYREVI